jgi:hypothetical protein
MLKLAIHSPSRNAGGDFAANPTACAESEEMNVSMSSSETNQRRFVDREDFIQASHIE